MSGFDVEDIRRLAELMKELELNELELVGTESKLRLKRDSNLTTRQQSSALSPGIQSPGIQSLIPSDMAGGLESSQFPATEPKTLPKTKGVLMSPMVGTVYMAPQPGDAPFVQVGAQVETGQVVLTLEAMKVMNPIKAPRAGTVTKILVADGQPVEFGEHLMVIE